MGHGQILVLCNYVSLLRYGQGIAGDAGLDSNNQPVRIYPPIIDLDLWRAVQDKLAQRARRKGAPNAGRQLHEFPFLGKLFWHDGRAYTAFKSSPRGKKHYTYYVAPATEQEKASQQPPFNISTDALHQALIEHLRSLFRTGFDATQGACIKYQNLVYFDV